MHEVLDAMSLAREHGVGAVLGVALGIAIAILVGLGQAPGCSPGALGFSHAAFTFQCAGQGSTVAGVYLGHTYDLPVAMVGAYASFFGFVGYAVVSLLRYGRRA